MIMMTFGFTWNFAEGWFKRTSYSGDKIKDDLTIIEQQELQQEQKQQLGKSIKGPRDKPPRDI